MCTWAAAVISRASCQLERTSPPLPRACWKARRFAGSFTTSCQASTGSPPTCSLAARYISRSTPRTYG
ncbi:hypothetical protein AVL61_06870 [Kocuria rosea subsp. polaris]|uniref:Uncharacterized protein n=1 Tax=Kocuria rosea subsp. polaris TaxID=136273 RepID=A0A0W8I3B9_KOCRO|nr:hypothetical protein AVL61_06870 [Kocuria polaris]